MEISAKDVNELRKQTGAGMMDCKKALTEAEGDFQKAIEILRKKGQKVSASRADRDAKEGAIFTLSDSGSAEAVMIELNCETDFVARNDDFQSIGNTIIKLALASKPADLDALINLNAGAGSIKDMLTDAMGRIGEKIDVRKYAFVSAERIVSYIHPGARVGVLVAFENTAGADVDSIGRDVAMQIAALSPVAVDKDDVDATLIQKEIEIGMDQARQEGKPEAMLEKIAQGKLQKFFKDNTLLNQEFVKDSSKSVAQYIKEKAPNLKVKSFKRFQLGV